MRKGGMMNNDGIMNIPGIRQHAAVSPLLIFSWVLKYKITPFFSESSISTTFAARKKWRLRFVKAAPKILLTIPLLNESEQTQAFLNSIRQQTFTNYKAIFCVNQPDHWWSDAQHRPICESNMDTLELLQQQSDDQVQVIDRCSPGNGWNVRHQGVGWARKTAMDEAARQADAGDLLQTMDGDTHYPSGFLQAVADDFLENEQVGAAAQWYYHPLTGQEAADRAVLRYEIYMRYYALNMLRIGNPYAFTAIGSAMACTRAAYKAVGGMTPHRSGEDFYFIQKLRKFTPVLIHTNAAALPAARFSDRVLFGTGPAMIRGDAGDWSSYPIYSYHFFDEVKATFDNFEGLFYGDMQLPMSAFLAEKFGHEHWNSLRQNNRDAKGFSRAAFQKIDALRILQFLRWRHAQQATSDEQNLYDFLFAFYPDDAILTGIHPKYFNFSTAAVEQLNQIRDFLTTNEKLWRQKTKLLR
jgi:hypothetical protein